MKKYNVILITIDSLRADHLNTYGYKYVTSPNLTEFAKDGVIFSKAFSLGSHIMTAFPSILSFNEILSNKTIFLSQVLQAHGFLTLGIHSNPFLRDYHKGFDIFIDLGDISFKLKYDKNENFQNIIKKFVKLLLPYGSIRRFIAYEFSKLYQALIARQKAPYASCEVKHERVLNLLKRNKSPFFLWLHYMDVHKPYLPPLKYISNLNSLKIYFLNQKLMRACKTNKPHIISEKEINYLIYLYDNAIRYLDDEIGKFINKLKKININITNTFFIITADHGEEFKEYGNLGHPPGKKNDVLLHVPLVICGPNLSPRVINKRVFLKGIGPTILKLLNLPLPDKIRNRIFFC